MIKRYDGVTFVGARHDFVLGIGMFEHALGAEHLLVVFAVELDLFVAVDVAHHVRIGLGPRVAPGRRRLGHRKSSKYRIVHWQVLCYSVVCDLVERALYYRMLVDLSETF
jgi:hypothetical protein